MTTKKTNKLSRRDAIKVLTAGAGAVTLTNLPERWSTPVLQGGAIPAHAQTSSCITVTVETVYAQFGASANITLVQGPVPSSQSGANFAFNLSQPYYAPAGNNSYSAIWTCSTGCLQLFLGGGGPGGQFIWRITVAGPNPFQQDFNNTTSNFLIDLDTGDLTANGSNTANCPFIN